MKRIKGFGGRSYGKRGNPMKDLVKLQEEFQKRLEELEKRYSEEIVEASAGGGAVKVKMSCDYRVLEVKIDEDLSGDVEMLEDLVVAVFNEALESVSKRRDEMARSEMGDMGMDGITGAIR